MQPAPAVPGASAAPGTGDTSSAGGAPIDAGQSSTAALNALLTQSLTADPKTGAANPGPTGGSSTPVTPTTASAAAAALTAAAQLPATPHAGSQATSASAATALTTQVGTSDWTEELGAKLTWMANQGIGSASLQLSPEHLGPLQVSISVHEGQASVWFGAAQADTRTALQQSLPQLRQLLANQGLNLADAGVSREAPRGQDRQSSTRSATSLSAATAVNADSSGGRGAITGGLGLLDTYV